MREFIQPKGSEIETTQHKDRIVSFWTVLGSTSLMGNNNRWSREGGVIDAIMVENSKPILA